MLLKLWLYMINPLSLSLQHYLLSAFADRP